ncbi:LOW QUALITY PROTEIN: prestin-like [Macrobrachium nipponense]|uniref:LOW QUALITY PROTEIN: prestin-like n=1 Tax=Macrobrachium nipponense TaxID=159736 RepID=UPI0030C84E9A
MDVGPPSMNEEEVYVVRPALTVEQRCQKYSYTPKTNLGLKEAVLTKTREYCTCSRGRLWAWCQARVPILHWLPNYPIRSALLGDVIAGITVAIMHIPQGMAYSLLANLPPITGLYMAFFPVLMYVFLGTSGHISMGTYAIGSLMMSKVVTELSSDDMESHQLPEGTPNATSTHTAQQVSAVLGFVVGIWEVAFGLLNFGEVLNVILSDMLISGFTTSVGFHVLTSQVKSLLGIPGIKSRYGPLKIIYTYIDILSNIRLAKVAVVLISLVCIAMLVVNNEILKPRVQKYTKLPIPMELIVVVLGTVASYYGDFHEKYDVRVVGEVPTGLPSPSLPPFEILPDVLVTGLIIGVVGYTSSFSMAKIFCKRHGYTIDGTQEFYAHGASNVFGSFFSCGPIAASLSRSLIQEAVGSVTLLTAFISCVFILLILLFIGPLFEALPNCVLSSIIVVSLKGLFLQMKELKTLWALSRSDAFIWLATFSGSVILDIDYGLLVGVLASLLVLLLKSQRPHTACLGQIPNTDLYLDVSLYPQVCYVDSNLQVVRFIALRQRRLLQGEVPQQDGPRMGAVERFQKGINAAPVKNSNPPPAGESNAPAAEDASTSAKDLKAPLAEDSNAVSEEDVSSDVEINNDAKKSGLPTITHENDRTRPEQVTAEDTKANGGANKESADSLMGATTTRRRRTSREERNTSAAVIAVYDVEWAILELSGVSFVDVSGCKCLTQLHKELQEVGITLCISGATDRVLEMLERCGTEKALGRERFFHSTHDAVTVITRKVNSAP